MEHGNDAPAAGSKTIYPSSVSSEMNDNVCD
jgi:hypothetical protein